MCALISYFTTPFCHFLFLLCSVGKILREQLLLSPVVVYSSVHPTSSPPILSTNIIASHYHSIVVLLTLFNLLLRSNHLFCIMSSETHLPDDEPSHVGHFPGDPRFLGYVLIPTVTSGSALTSSIRLSSVLEYALSIQLIRLHHFLEVWVQRRTSPL